MPDVLLSLLPSAVALEVSEHLWVSALAIAITQYVKVWVGAYLSDATRDFVLPLVALATITFFVHDIATAIILWLIASGTVKYVHGTVDRMKNVDAPKDELT